MTTPAVSQPDTGAAGPAFRTGVLLTTGTEPCPTAMGWMCVSRRSRIISDPRRIHVTGVVATLTALALGDPRHVTPIAADVRAKINRIVAAATPDRRRQRDD